MSRGEWAAAARVLRDGGVVALPTDTVWGLVTMATNESGVERIFAIKGRPGHLELPLLAGGIADLTGLVRINASAERLAVAFWPGALTMILPCLAPRATLAIPRRGDTLAVRVPAHPKLQTVMAITGPLASTSANPHGEPPGLTPIQVRARLGDRVDMVVDDADPVAGMASTIVDCTREPVTVTRAGALDPGL